MNVEAVLFDLDGVLVDACDWHYLALNSALEAIGVSPISREDHITTYNGLPTKVKLEMLGLHEDECALVWKLKQDHTLQTIKDNATIQEEKIELFSSLKKDGVRIGCVTNSIETTTHEMLKTTGQFEFFDLIITNEMVEKNKPHPDCYNLAVDKLGVDPKKCVIVEDSPKGLESARLSNIPNVWHVFNSKEVTLEKYRRFVNENFNTDGR
jgi:HAD superfamily hydrolase (TIGR01509 family)